MTRSDSASFDSQRLAEFVIAKRGSRGLRATAAEIGDISASTLSRIEQGRIPDLETFIRLCRWLGVPPAEFTGTDAIGPQPQPEGPRVDMIAAHLRADRTLDRETARALERMVRLAYRAAISGTLPPEDRE